MTARITITQSRRRGLLVLVELAPESDMPPARGPIVETTWEEVPQSARPPVAKVRPLAPTLRRVG